MNKYWNYSPKICWYNLTEAEQKELIQAAVRMFKKHHYKDI